MPDKSATNGPVPVPKPERKMTSEFTSKAPEFRKRRQSSKKQDILDMETSLSELWAGLAMSHSSSNDDQMAIGCSLHDGTYPIDFSITQVEFNDKMTRREGQQMIEDYIILDLKMYQKDHLSKVLGVGVTADLDRAAPQLCSRLWAELDIVPMVFDADTLTATQGHKAGVDEIADSVARKCISLFGPLKQPRLAISYRNEVQVDLTGRAKLTTRADYEKTVRPPTWRTVNKLIKEVKDKNIRFAFFSATPQGGGVALMRHALLRFLREFGVRVEWYVPRPRPDVFRITKTNHNIFQGVVPPDTRVTKEQLDKIGSWVRDNANKYWLSEGGPLRPVSKGGADVIICDDPQMPEVIKISKEQDPDRPIIFRSHIEVRDDLISQDGSAAQFLWNSMWENIKNADVFISHPVKSFVPKEVKPSILGWLPATTDWLDGLNKKMTGLELQYYMRILKQDCQAQKLACLTYPERPYITQIARFDPSKGIPDVIKSYAKLIELMKESNAPKPQLIVCGHGSVDDPDGAIVYDETMELIEKKFAHLIDDIVIIRIGPSDQILNAILSLSKVVLQLSLREGFEVKVSEALHKGKPVIATRTGGIPLQIQDGKSGFVVERGDTDAVAKHMYDLFTDKDLYHEMSRFAKDNVSDEVHTVGNAIAWLWLVKSLQERRGKEGLKLNSKWVNDLAREEAGEPYKDGEPRLPRNLST